MEGTDPELVSRAVAGDRRAFGTLVERHSVPVWSAVSRAVSNRELAREVFQDTWVRAFERLHTLREPDRLRSWLLSIALNLTRQLGRRPESVGIDGEDVTEPRDSAGGGSAGLERGELRAALARAIAELPRRQREVVRLRVHFEESYAAIGRALGISEENARANFYQGLRRLRARFEDDEPR